MNTYATVRQQDRDTMPCAVCKSVPIVLAAAAEEVISDRQPDETQEDPLLAAALNVDADALLALEDGDEPEDAPPQPQAKAAPEPQAKAKGKAKAKAKANSSNPAAHVVLVDPVLEDNVIDVVPKAKAKAKSSSSDLAAADDAETQVLAAADDIFEPIAPAVMSKAKAKTAPPAQWMKAACPDAPVAKRKQPAACVHSRAWVERGIAGFFATKANGEPLAKAKAKTGEQLAKAKAKNGEPLATAKANGEPLAKAKAKAQPLGEPLAKAKAKAQPLETATVPSPEVDASLSEALEATQVQNQGENAEIWTCTKCNKEYDSKLVQPCEKLKDTCPSCRSVRSRLYREGAWSDVSSLDAEDQIAFFAAGGDMTTAQLREKLKSLVQKKSENHDAHEETEKTDRPFLPLGVWQQQGYDPELIKSDAEPDDVRYIKQLGWCYRAPLMSSSSSDSRGWKNSQTAALPSSGSLDSVGPATKKLRDESPKTTKARIEQTKKLEALKKKENDKLQNNLVMPLASSIPNLPGPIASTAKHYLQAFMDAQKEIKEATSPDEVNVILAQLKNEMNVCLQLVKGFKGTTPK